MTRVCRPFTEWFEIKMVDIYLWMALPLLALGIIWLYFGVSECAEISEGLLRNDLFQGGVSIAMGGLFMLRWRRRVQKLRELTARRKSVVSGRP